MYKFYFLMICAVTDGRQKFKVTATHQLSNAMHTSGWQNFYWFVELVFD